MTYTEQIIQKAIDGGYDNELGLFNLPDFSPYHKSIIHLVLFLDPDFWRCLGKAMGWDSRPVQECEYLINHLFSGGTIESYSKELIEDEQLIRELWEQENK